MGCGCNNNGKKITPVKTLTSNTNNSKNVSPIKKTITTNGRRIIKRRAF